MAIPSSLPIVDGLSIFLAPLTFQTSILCQTFGIAKDGFYSSMREGYKYDANDNQDLDTLGYDYDFSTLDARADGTDAFDTLYIRCEKFPFNDSFSLSTSGVL